MATQKPNLNRVWAAGAPPINVVDPDVTIPGKFDAGWLAEVPPFEHFNFLQQLFTQGLAHANEQGIMVWDSNTTYPISALVKGSDGLIYEALVEQDGNDPVSDSGTNWGLAITSGVIAFDNVTDMQNGTTIIGKAVSFKVGQLLSTGVGKWRVNSNKGLALTGGLFATPLNGVWIDDCGAKGDALFRDDSTGNWYVDSGLTIAANDDTAAFQLAMTATGGTDSKGTINFGQGGYLISPETVDVDGIDIRQKTLNGLGPESTQVVQSGNNTYQTLFRNNPRNLSEAGTWGSGGTYNIKNMYLRGNWDGSSDQTFIPPTSGNGNGLTGILKAQYDFDAQGGVIQLISATRAFLNNVWVSHGYGHNIKYYRHGYGQLVNGRSFATRGSGTWILCPSASDSFTSTPIHNMRYETCRGEFGGLNILHMWGNSITDCLFEGQPYGIYMDESGDVDTSGSYLEAHYFEDFYIASECWGIVDLGNYAFGQDDRRTKNYKGLMHYRRDDGLHVDTDNVTFGTRPASINNFYMQRTSIGHNVQPAPLTGTGGIYHQLVQQLSQGGGSSLEWFTSIRHSHNDSDDSGAAEIRFKRNLNQNSWAAIAFATYDGANLEDRFLIDRNGDIEVLGVGDGVVLASPNGTRYRVTVDNAGTLVTTAV